ncbi:branched-chain amino acid ABC transporter permease [Frigidibacter sp. MR17.14]|uniref:branched-chain amino acid ABC transporter permease n=1 Tax=Frigidibacter sp. MR17.14 TaxID=3126509 RepID=UPI00301302E6
MSVLSSLQRRPEPSLQAAFALFALMALLPPVVVSLGDPFLIVVGTRMLVFAIAALSLDLILGYGALVSFGHAAYLGLGAYAVGVMMRWGIDDLILQILAALAVALPFAAVTGAISLRTRGIYFIMITLAFGQMAYFFFVSLSSLGGDDGMALDHRSTLLGAPVMASDAGLYYTTLVVLILTFVGLWTVTRSRFGRVLVGTRESALRMQAIGFRPLPYQLAAYLISAGTCAVAGVFLANQALYVSPAYMSWQRSGELIVMVILGGIGNLAGAIAGALVTIGLEEGLARFSDHWRLGFGLILVLVVLYSPGGVTGLIRRLTGRTGA